MLSRETKIYPDGAGRFKEDEKEDGSEDDGEGDVTEGSGPGTRLGIITRGGWRVRVWVCHGGVGRWK